MEKNKHARANVRGETARLDEATWEDILNYSKTVLKLVKRGVEKPE